MELRVTPQTVLLFWDFSDQWEGWVLGLEAVDIAQQIGGFEGVHER